MASHSFGRLEASLHSSIPSALSRLATSCVYLAIALVASSPLWSATSAGAARAAPAWPDALSTFGPRPLYSAGIAPTVIVDTFGAIDTSLTTQRLQEISNTIDEWRLEGISYAAYYSMWKLESDPSSALYQTLSNTALSVDLNGTARGPLSITHQAWRDYLSQSAQMAIDAGADYIILDVAMLGLDSFDGEVLAGFRDDLAAHYTTVELAGMGVADVASFDYRQYLLGQGYSSSDSSPGSVLSNPPTDALWTAWVDYHHRFERDFFTQWTGALRSHAISKGQVVRISVNRPTWGSGSGQNKEWDMADLMDITMAETFLDSLGYPDHDLSFDYKISMALGKRFWSWNFPANTNFPTNPPSTDTSSQLFSAETFAYGGLNQIPMVWSDFFQNGLRVDYLVPYYALPTRHPGLFNLPEEGEIGVLYSQAGDSLDSLAMGRAFRGAIAMLEASHRPYDVIFSGTARSLSASDLSAYKAVLLPDTRYLSSAEVTILEDYLTTGGTLIGCGMIGDEDETGSAVSRPITSLFSTPGVQHPASGGTVISFPDSSDSDITVRLYDAADGTASGRTQMAALLGQFETMVDPALARDVVTDLPLTVHITRYRDPADQSAVYHLLNYDYDMTTDSVTPVAGAQLRVPVPAGFDANTLVISFMTPANPAPQVLTANVSSGRANFTLPALDIWAIVKVGSGESASPPADRRPQSDLIDWVKERPDTLDTDGTLEFPFEYWRGTSNSGQFGVTPFAIPFTATDDHGLSRVDLYARYSADGSSWGSWSRVDSASVSGPSVVSSFTEAPATNGYYQYHSVAIDDAAQAEIVLARDEIAYGVDATAPSNPAGVVESHGVQDGVPQSSVTTPTFTWTLPADDLSGASEYWLSFRDSADQVLAFSNNQPAAVTSWSPGTFSVPGTYTLNAYTGDLAGNKASSQVLFHFVAQAAGSGNFAPTSTSATLSTDEDTQSSAQTPSVSDPDPGDTHTFSIVSLPTHGQASISSNALRYTPDPGYSGPDSFSYRATDLYGASVVGTARVDVSAGAPASQEFNIDFGLHDGPPSPSYAAASNGAGVWNEVGLGTSGAMLDLAGQATNVHVLVQAGSDTGFGGPAPTGDADYLLTDFFSNANAAAWRVDLSGLLPGNYWLWFYAPVSLPTGALLIDGLPVQGLPGDPNGLLIEGTSFEAISVATSTGSVTIQGGSPWGSGLAGLQVLATPEPSPASLTLAALMSLTVLARRRRRMRP